MHSFLFESLSLPFLSFFKHWHGLFLIPPYFRSQTINEISYQCELLIQYSKSSKLLMFLWWCFKILFEYLITTLSCSCYFRPFVSFVYKLDSTLTQVLLHYVWQVFPSAAWLSNNVEMQIVLLQTTFIETQFFLFCLLSNSTYNRLCFIFVFYNWVL
jgi:hypothetical protein